MRKKDVNFYLELLKEKLKHLAAQAWLLKSRIANLQALEKISNSHPKSYKCVIESGQN
jgi:hypothetical protein